MEPTDEIAPRFSRGTSIGEKELEGSANKVSEDVYSSS